MSSKNKFEWKTAGIVVLILAAIFIGAASYIKSNNNYKVVHFKEVKSEVGPDGRAAVGAPESYKIEVSPASIWNKTKSNTGKYKAVAWVFLIVAAAFITIQKMDTFDLGRSGSNLITYSLMVIALSFFIAAYSSAFANNYVEMSKAEYDQVKDDPAKIEQLFKDREYIR
jgi:hypothetical protein